MDTFEVTAKAISQRKKRYMQLFVSDTGLMYVYPMKVKTEIVNAVKAFAKAIGVPKAANDMNLPLKFLERRTQWANLAELYIGVLKEAVQKDMKDLDSPLKFWDYCAERIGLIDNLT